MKSLRNPKPALRRVGGKFIIFKVVIGLNNASRVIEPPPLASLTKAFVAFILSILKEIYSSQFYLG